jgi:hypothetical protein
MFLCRLASWRRVSNVLNTHTTVQPSADGNGAGKTNQRSRGPRHSGDGGGPTERRMMICGKPNCRCAHNPDARHGPYYLWGHMKGGKLVNRMASPEQAALLRLAIANYRQARKLMRAWEKETERLIDAETTDEP